MKFGTINDNGRPTVVVRIGAAGIFRLTELCRAAGIKHYDSLLDLIEQVDDIVGLDATLSAHVSSGPRPG